MESSVVRSVYRFSTAAALVLLAAGAEHSAQAYPLNPWGTITAKGAVALTPYLYVYNSGHDWYPYLYGSYGINDKVDVIAGVGFGLGSANGLDGLELYGRYFLRDEVALVAHLNYSGGSFSIAPEVDFVLSKGAFTFTGNLGVYPSFGGGGIDFGGYLAPEYALSDRFSLFLEVNPYIVRLPTDSDGDGTEDSKITATSVVLVPGVGFSLDEEGNHTMAVGVQITPPLTSNVVHDNLSLGVWYSTSFGGE
jgi:hypothetical protein